VKTSTITVTSTIGYNKHTVILVDQDFLEVIAVNPTSLTVTRYNHWRKALNWLRQWPRRIINHTRDIWDTMTEKHSE
jgi:hypothetical protein